MNQPFDIPTDFFDDFTESESEKQRYVELLGERRRRRQESLQLYEATELQERYHASRKKQCVLSAANQFGKSLAGFVEDARAVTGQDPYDKYPKTDGICVIIGWDEEHIGKVVHKYLFREGAFKIIDDLETGEPRVWKPWLESDVARIAEAKPSPPLIPPRFWKDGYSAFTWKKKGSRIFSKFYCTTGWEIWCLTSGSDPPGGFQCDLVHIDEKLSTGGWYEEMMPRLAMRKGKFRWTSLPYENNDVLMDLRQRAEDEEQAVGEATVELITATLFDNPFMPEEEKQELIRSWSMQGEEMVRLRAYGQPATDSLMMYPQFSRMVHGAPYAMEPRHCIHETLERHPRGEPDWCYYTSTDPGHGVCAAVLIGIPPPEKYGAWFIQLDELYIHHADEEAYGEGMERLCSGLAIRQHIIDMHGSKPTDTSGESSLKRFGRQLLKRNLIAIGGSQAHGYVFGSDDIQGRAMAVRSLLRVRPDGNPTYLMMAKACQNTLQEFAKYRKQTFKNAGGVLLPSDLPRKGNNHAMDALGYAAFHGCPYIQPPKPEVVHYAWNAMDEFVKKLLGKQRPPEASISLGPTGV